MTSAIAWPAARVEEAIQALALICSLPVPPAVTAPADGGGFSDTLTRAAERLGFEVQQAHTSLSDFGAFARGAGPAVILVDGGHFVVLVGGSRRIRVLGPDHRIVSISADHLRDSIAQTKEPASAGDVASIVAGLHISQTRQAAVAKALLRERLHSQRLDQAWMLRRPVGSSFVSQLSGAGIFRRTTVLALAHGTAYTLFVAAWWLLGSATLRGAIDTPWLVAFALTLATMIPVQLAALSLQGTIAIDVGTLIRQRLLAGALRLDTDRISREGTGHLLGRVIEAEVAESLALSGGFSSLLAVIELLVAAMVLAWASPMLTAILLLWMIVGFAAGALLLQRRSDWVRRRVRLTLDLIERMIGHRTRIAQQPREHWGDGEDEMLARTVDSATVMDDVSAVLLAGLARGWMVIGLAGLSPLFLRGDDTVPLAVGLGGVLLAFRAFDRLKNGLISITTAAIAWQQTLPVLRAAAPPPAAPVVMPASSSTVLEAAELRYTHSGRGQPVLHRCSLRIDPGARLILSGTSGSGKSTLAALLAALKSPDAGVLLINGLDRHSVSFDDWRQRVRLIPQYHQNHLFAGSLAFNVLMGVEWPPTAADLRRAESVLRELGLGGLLDRMPSGLFEMVGETGWQLSHGERSRVFLARGLLQQPHVLILDEALAQLDHESATEVIATVDRHAGAALLIAHP